MIFEYPGDSKEPFQLYIPKEFFNYSKQDIYDWWAKYYKQVNDLSHLKEHIQNIKDKQLSFKMQY